MTVLDTYSDHVSQLVKQLSKIKGVLLKLSHVVPSFVIRNIYYALFYSRISYNITVWGNGNVTGVDRVRKINKSIMDIFLNTVPNSIPGPFLYNDLYNFACSKTLHKYNYNINTLLQQITAQSRIRNLHFQLLK